jgi:hypothetical protein
MELLGFARHCDRLNRSAALPDERALSFELAAELFALARRGNFYKGKFTKLLVNMQVVVQNATARTSPEAEVQLLYFTT